MTWSVDVQLDVTRGFRDVITRRRFLDGDLLFHGLLLLACAIVLGVLVGLFYELTVRSFESFGHNGLRFLWTSRWDPVHNVYGAAPLIFGSLLTALTAMILATLLGVGVSLFLVELAPSWIAQPVSFMVEMLAAIPSVVYGLWGIFVLAPYLREHVERPLYDHLSVRAFLLVSPGDG